MGRSCRAAAIATMLMIGSADGTEPLAFPDPAFETVGPYPNADDVCMLLKEDMAPLIGCPEGEAGAIEDRLAEGSRVVGAIRGWTLLSLPRHRRRYHPE